jgi:hypothetical protein
VGREGGKVGREEGRERASLGGGARAWAGGYTRARRARARVASAVWGRAGVDGCDATREAVRDGARMRCARACALYRMRHTTPWTDPAALLMVRNPRGWRDARRLLGIASVVLFLPMDNGAAGAQACVAGTDGRTCLCERACERARARAWPGRTDGPGARRGGGGCSRPASYSPPAAAGSKVRRRRRRRRHYHYHRCRSLRRQAAKALLAAQAPPAQIPSWFATAGGGGGSKNH